MALPVAKEQSSPEMLAAYDQLRKQLDSDTPDIDEVLNAAQDLAIETEEHLGGGRIQLIRTLNND